MDNVKLHVSDNIVKCKEKSLTFTPVKAQNIPAGKLEKEEEKKIKADGFDLTFSSDFAGIKENNFFNFIRN